MMIWLAICTILSIPELLSFNLYVMGHGLFGFLIDGYSFVIIYSLRALFRDEFVQGVNFQINAQQSAQPPQYGDLSDGQQTYSQQPDNSQQFMQQPSNPQDYMQQQSFNPQYYAQPQSFNQP